MSIEVYTFRDDNDNEDTFSTQDPVEAHDYAVKHERQVFANTYVWADAELVDDFRPAEPVEA